MSATPLTRTELDQALGELSDWSVQEGQLYASFTLDRAALPALYAAVAAVEDQANHHASVHILYNTITFALDTHDAGGAITALDTALAARLSALAAQHGSRPSGP